MDPVVSQVILTRLSGIVLEMQGAISRTGYSTIIRESQDASCMLLDAGGRPVGESWTVAIHVPCLGAAVANILRDFGDDLHRGDAFITNHPY